MVNIGCTELTVNIVTGYVLHHIVDKVLNDVDQINNIFAMEHY